MDKGNGSPGWTRANDLRTSSGADARDVEFIRREVADRIEECMNRAQG
jgi:hypothetical protein